MMGVSAKTLRLELCIGRNQKPSSIYTTHSRYEILYSICLALPALNQSVSARQFVNQTYHKQIWQIAIGGHRYWKVYSTSGLTFRVMIGYNEQVCWAVYMLIGYNEAVCWAGYMLIGYSEALCWAGYMLIGYSEAVIC